MSALPKPIHLLVPTEGAQSAPEQAQSKLTALLQYSLKVQRFAVNNSALYYFTTTVAERVAEIQGLLGDADAQS